MLMVEDRAERQPGDPLDTGERAEQGLPDLMTPAELLVHLAEVVREQAQNPEFQRQELRGISTNNEIMEFVDETLKDVALTLEAMAEQKSNLAFITKNIVDTVDLTQARQERVELQRTMMRMEIKPVGMSWAYWGLSENSGKLLNLLLAEAREEISEVDYTNVQDLDYDAAVEELRESGVLQDGDLPRLKFDFNR